MKIRRLIRRMDLNAHDAEVWLGMLRQLQWKLKSMDGMLLTDDEGNPALRSDASTK
jgi:tRNA C32,U32 (ribose-2'-O)-methylase TrmJ